MGERYTYDITRADIIAPELQRRIRDKFDTTLSWKIWKCWHDSMLC